MQAVDLGPVTVEDYLAGEPESACRNEYLGGTLYAMAGASEEHNLISLTVFRRSNWWQPELVWEPADSLRLLSLEFTLPLAAIYEGVNLPGTPSP